MCPWNSNGNSSSSLENDCNGSENGNRNCIEHQVSRFDTLAGVAIKYGVEVADIKRLNNLVTDLQMFALKSLQIPLPGRHPPSPVLPHAFPNTRESTKAKTFPCLGPSNTLEPFLPLRSKSPPQKVSSAMDTLQKFYGLKSPNLKGSGEAEGMEMAVYSNGETAEDTPLEEAGDGEADRSNEKSVRRRQKSEADSKAGEDNGGGSSDFSPITGKGLAMRPKSASRTNLATEAESGWLGPIPVGLFDSILTEGISGIRKSSSMPSIPEPDNNSSSSAWPTHKWSLKPDLQVLSAASITRPIFDGLPKPITGRRNKAALD